MYSGQSETVNLVPLRSLPLLDLFTSVATVRDVTISEIAMWARDVWLPQILGSCIHTEDPVVDLVLDGSYRLCNTWYTLIEFLCSMLHCQHI